MLQHITGKHIMLQHTYINLFNNLSTLILELIRKLAN